MANTRESKLGSLSRARFKYSRILIDEARQADKQEFIPHNIQHTTPGHATLLRYVPSTVESIIGPERFTYFGGKGLHHRELATLYTPYVLSTVDSI